MPKSASNGPLHFASQAAADSYLVSQQIERMENVRVTRSRGSLSSSLQARLAALNEPVYKLSDDILSIIFLLVVEETDTPGAISLSHVVSRWWRVALAMPRLWASITINFPLRPKVINRLKVMSRRAAAIPLRMHLRSSGYNTQKGQSSTLREIMSLCSRCTALSVDNGMSNAAGDFMSSLLLNVMQIPNLRSLSLVGLTLDVESCRVFWNNFKMLHFLEDLLMQINALYLPPDSQIVELPSLHRLTFDRFSLLLLSRLALPSLDSICIDCTGASSTLDLWIRVHAPDPKLFRDRILTSLKCIKLEHATVHRQQLITLIRVIPRLEHICLVDARFNFQTEFYTNPDNPCHLLSKLDIQRTSISFSLNTLTFESCSEIAHFLRDLLETPASTEGTLKLGTILIKNCLVMSDRVKALVKCHAEAVEWIGETGAEWFQPSDPEWLLSPSEVDSGDAEAGEAEDSEEE